MKKKTLKRLPKDKTHTKLQLQIEELTAKLDEAHETIRAIQNGEIDALIMNDNGTDQIFTLDNADHPYRLLVESMNEGALTLNHEGIIFYSNQHFAISVHIPLEDLIGTSFKRFIHEDELPIFEKSFEDGKKDKSKSIVQLINGYDKTVPFLLSMSAVDVETGKGACIVATDLTEQKGLEQSRADVEKLTLEKELRERFVALLSHDLRNPLSVAMTSAQMIIRSQQHAGNHLKYAANILRSVERADQMIQSLLDANQISAGQKLPMKITKCDMFHTVERALEDLRMLYGDRFLFNSHSPVLGYWSADHIKRLIENLASNAAKYGYPNTPITISLIQTSKQICLSVHNEGNTLKKNEQSTLFQPFIRSSSAKAGVQQGWGLGLSLVRGVAEAHGGIARVESLPKKGTTFSVIIPMDARPFQDL